MKVLRAHDYQTRPEFRPNVRALRGILAALAASAFFCICVAIALLPRLHNAQHSVQPPVRCTQTCTCRANKPVSTSKSITPSMSGAVCFHRR
jgi:hypothetical protein